MRILDVFVGAMFGSLCLLACTGEKHVAVSPAAGSGETTKAGAPSGTKSSSTSEEAPDLDAAIFHAKSASHHFAINRAGGDTPAMKVEGDVTRTALDHRMHYTVTGAAAAEDNGEWITMDSKVYQKPGSSAAWKEVTNEAAHNLIESALFIKQEDMDEARHIGTDTMNGKQAHHYTRAGKFATNKASYDFWVDGENVVKCQAKSENGVTYTTVFSNFGSVPDIKKPV